MIKFLYSRTRTQWLAATAWMLFLLLLWVAGLLKSYEILAYIATFIMAVYIGHVTTIKR